MAKKINLSAINQGLKSAKTINWPGTEEQVDMRILSAAEVQQAKASTDKYCLKLYGEYGYANADAWEDERAYQTLYRALRQPGTKEPLTDSIKEFRDQVFDGVRDCLLDEYTAMVSDIDPAALDIDDTQLNEVLDELIKKPATLANFSSSILLKKLLHTSAARLAILQPPSDSSSTAGPETENSSPDQDNNQDQDSDQKSKTKDSTLADDDGTTDH